VHMSDPTESVPGGPTSPESQTVLQTDGPTAGSGRGEWTQRFLRFGLSIVCAIAEIAWLTVLAWATLSLMHWLFP